jgi:hypothetical protein
MSFDGGPGFDGKPVIKVEIAKLRDELKTRGALERKDKGGDGLSATGRTHFRRTNMSLLDSGGWVEKDGLHEQGANARLFHGSGKWCTLTTRKSKALGRSPCVNPQFPFVSMLWRRSLLNVACSFGRVTVKGCGNRRAIAGRIVVRRSGSRML